MQFSIQMEDRINALRLKLEARLQKEDLPPVKRLNDLNLLIQVRQMSINKPDKLIYKETKELISVYCETVEAGKFGYDKINLNKILSYLNPFELDQQIALLSYTKRILTKYQYFSEADELEKVLKKKRFNSLFKDINVKKITLIILTYPSLGLKQLILTLIVFYLTLCAGLTESSFGVLIFEKQELVENNLLNHLINVLALIFQLDSEIGVHPISWFGYLLAAIAKSIFIIFIINYLIQQLSKHLDLEK
ncbi:MAG: hypothetical protein HWE07_04050 [Cytophagia bacterium]|nr:hypothetical protein [Cytophagia bacterium]